MSVNFTHSDQLYNNMSEESVPTIFDITLESGRVPKTLLEAHGVYKPPIADVYSESSLYCGVVLNVKDAAAHLDFLVEALPYFSQGGLGVGTTEGGWFAVSDGDTIQLLAGLTLYILSQLLSVIALKPELIKDYTINAGDDSRWVLLNFDASSNTIVLTSESEDVFGMVIPRKVFVDAVLRLGTSFLDLMEALEHHIYIREQDKQAAARYIEHSRTDLQIALQANGL